MKRRFVPVIRVFPMPRDRRRGMLVAGTLALPCALGRGGTTSAKREGDGASPIGCFDLIGGYFRADRLRRPRTGLALRPIRREDGWCDDPRHARYNTLVKRPFPASHEALWRDDRLYDVVLDIAWNRRPAVKGRGSAIFLHLAKPGLAPTEGCVALEPRAAARLLELIGPRTRITILR
jgi:L,D-peptidoglycan transpeptidase YkuD (ErfK/YbiS/YcfS/YnhG family)